MARETGLEPATSAVTGRRSNQLSYSRNPIRRAWEARITNEVLRDAAPIVKLVYREIRQMTVKISHRRLSRAKIARSPSNHHYSANALKGQGPPG